MIKKSLVIGVLVLSGFSAWYMFKHRQDTMKMQQEATVVQVEKVRQGTIAIEAHAIGTLVAEKDAQITSEVSGNVAKLLFKDGVFVKQGQSLIQLDDTVYKAKSDSSKANLLYSETNYKRNVLLGKRGAISQQAIDQALADLKEKQAAAQEDQVTLNKMLLVAPFDGVLGKCTVNVGDYVTVGQQLVSLTDVKHLRVEYSVPEKYLPVLKLGQEVKITTSTYPDKEFSGKVAFISPTINANDHTISLYADISNENGSLTSGLFVNVTQSLGVKNNALLVSASSLMPTIDGQQVYKVVDNKAVAIPVTVSQRTTNDVEIMQGLTAGDDVVTAGQQKLKDGMPVKIKM